MADDRTYIRVHDGLDEHPKVEPLSDAGFRLLMTCWFYCSRNRTDGRITDAVWKRRGTPKARRELLAAGLVEQRDGHVEMHDYLEHQRSAEEIKLLQEVRGDASVHGNHIRWHVVRRKPKKDCDLCYPPDEDTPGTIANRIANGIPNRSQTDPKPIASTETEAEASTDASVGYVEKGGLRTERAGDKPPLYSERCAAHGDVPDPGPCGRCADVRKAAQARPDLRVVKPHHQAAWCGHCDDPGTRVMETPTGLTQCPACHPAMARKCLIHLEDNVQTCRGCAADRKAAS